MALSESLDCNFFPRQPGIYDDLMDMAEEFLDLTLDKEDKVCHPCTPEPAKTIVELECGADT